MAPATAAVAHAAGERPSNMFGLPQSEAHTQAVRGLEVSQPLAPHHLPAETIAQSHVVRADIPASSTGQPLAGIISLRFEGQLCVLPTRGPSFLE
jgi:hypothetical protein